MIRRYQRQFRALLVLVDSLLAVAVLGGVSMARYGAGWYAAWQAQIPAPLGLLLLYVAGWVALLALFGLYRPGTAWTARREAIGIAQAAVVMGVATLAGLYLGHLDNVSRAVLLASVPLQAGVSFVSRLALRAAFRALRRRGHSLRFVLVVGTGELARAFVSRLERHPEMGLRVEGFVGGSAADVPEGRWLGPIDRTEDILHERVIDEVAVCLSKGEWAAGELVVELAESEGKIVRIPLAGTPVPGRLLAGGQPEDLGGMPIYSIVRGPDRMLGLAAKRAIDIVGATIGLIVLSPVFIVAGIAIVLTDGRPVLFRQARAGVNGRPFQIAKFRTMARDADARRAELREFNEVKGGASFKMTNDPRITRVGRILRRTSVDELPQLWNVLRGDMSLVGPRPHPFDDVAGYRAWHRRRLSVKPGITGLWQIGGRRDDDFDRWVEKDLEYIDGWSFWLDLRVIVSTIPALLRAEGR